MTAATRPRGGDVRVDVTAEVARLRALADPAPGRVLYALCALGVADRLAASPQPTAALAEAVGADEDALRRVLRVAAELRVVRQQQDTWYLLPAGDLLRSDVPGSLRAEFADNDLFRLWTGFLDTVRTGEPCYPTVFGAPLFDRLTATPEAMRSFHQHMDDRAELTYAPLLDLPVWPSDGVLVDVAGGTGGLLRRLLESRPSLRGVLHDLPSVLALSPLRHRADLAGRIRFASADMFTEPLPAGDVHLLASVLHDWPDRTAATILSRCRPADRLLVVDRVAPDDGPGTGSGGVFRNDLLMLAAVGGRERTRAEWTALLAGAGFTLDAVRGAEGTELSVLECRPVPS
ncbi:methyltransferase [Plantactinospora endophytica]|uniref:Methyltransferase n=1 Tax=Plantactinospora endophytica TaxID=673535 RepID=A0ABQ4ECA1_9ACTN|nr:methyltransferase [Plantactinospora endophytica]GIG92284.1 methyltransferase [Plantactinospora endophytica]